MIAEILRLLQASSCFRGEVCASLPCACAETLAALSRPAQRPPTHEALIRDVAVLLARHDYRFGMGGNDEAAYAFANSHKFEKRAAEVVALTSTVHQGIEKIDGGAS